jgi:hypothetical protein
MTVGTTIDSESSIEIKEAEKKKMQEDDDNDSLVLIILKTIFVCIIAVVSSSLHWLWSVVKVTLA